MTPDRWLSLFFSAIVYGVVGMAIVGVVVEALCKLGVLFKRGS